MKSSLKIQQVESKVLSVRGEKVLLDSDVAAFYDVETREVNQAIKNNPDKFPEGYIIQLSKDEWVSLRSKILTLEEIDEEVKNFDRLDSRSQIVTLNEESKPVTNCDQFETLRSKILTSKEKSEPIKIFDRLKHSTVPPKAFTEKGLYMLATILKGKQAVQTTIAIVETFTKIRELSRTVEELAKVPDEAQQKTLMQKGGEIMADLIASDLKATDTETSFELNFAVMKFKHTVRKGAKK